MGLAMWCSLGPAAWVPETSWPSPSCAGSALGLGADLTLPSAFAGVIHARGTALNRGRVLRLVAFATKLNLALAAGIALPALSWFGYAPGSHSERALQA